MITLNKIHKWFLLAILASGCYKSKEAKSELDCHILDQDTIAVYIGRYFHDDKITIKINDHEYYSALVKTDPSIDIATVKFIPMVTVRKFTFIVNDRDSLVLCPAPFLVVNFIDNQIQSESFDSSPRFE